jgi:hypothetical protein
MVERSKPRNTPIEYASHSMGQVRNMPKYITIGIENMLLIEHGLSFPLKS